MNKQTRNEQEQIALLHNSISGIISQFSEESIISDAMLDDLGFLINDFIQSYKLCIEIEPFERYYEEDEFDDSAY